MSLRPEDTSLLREIRRALASPFADPVNVGGLSMPRASARMIERNLSCSARKVGAA